MSKLKKIPLGKMKKGMLEDMDGPSQWPPSFSVRDSQMPEIRKWKVGEKYTMIIEVEMKSFEDRSIADKPKKINASASFDILAYKPMDDVDDMSDEEFEKKREEALSS